MIDLSQTAWTGLATVSSVTIVAFALLAGFDGVNLHLIRYRLWARATSRTEHLVHTARAFAFPLQLALVFTGRGGPFLWAGLTVVAIDTALEAYDVAIEPASRADLGGLDKNEAVLHNILGTLRAAAIVAALAARPASAYRWTDATDLAAPSWVIVVIAALMIIATITACVHVWLATRPLDPTDPESTNATDHCFLETR